MRRLFWIGVGAGAALYAQRKTVKFVRSLTPQNLAVLAVEQAAKRGEEAGNRLKALAEDVRYHMAVREAELQEAIELDQAPPLDPRGAIPGRVLRARPVGSDRPEITYDKNEDGTHGVG
ncbi:hypothetical protein LO762_07350 [Actinocorallia sp. API 0066]|uniref:hypothetical protein n=1 Tax=Actinocorallia sp. API 0066 TaxID=2896846 RepID=UPI001E299032|nr:hypothetical protein [Actinocorallia sp. API 0066]MCD0449005.1 hypothetical protein [Actinocorallia sp. API 0066]